LPLHRGPDRAASPRDDVSVNPLFARPEMTALPKDRLGEGPTDPDTAYQIVHDELMLDGNARTNLATFVTTWMEPQGSRLMSECADKNMVDKDEYPRTAELERRCVNILADLWNAPGPEEAVGCSTTGSSEACMLGGLALERRWRKRAGSGSGERPGRPNLVMGVNVQVCWEKFCNYWDIEPRCVPMEGDRFHLTAETAVEQCDENTIGVVAILGSTMDGSYEPVEEIARALDELQEREGHDIPIHVDAAGGAMVAPFLDPDLVWDFRLPRVASINVSGHKYGLVYPGIGWVVWRDGDALPEELVFKVNYLGGEMPTFSLTFSRPGSQVAAQYYNFLRLGFEGYRAVQQECRDVARGVAKRIAEMEPFELLTEGGELPAFAFRMHDEDRGFSVFDVSMRLREHGWIVPAYTFPRNREDLAVLRIVVRNGFSPDLAELLLGDLEHVVSDLSDQEGRPRDSKATSFHH
jgi:glutamate decarboxylase